MIPCLRGVERWAERRALLSHEGSESPRTEDVEVANCTESGIRFVRTHVDVSESDAGRALKADMLEVKQEVAPWVGCGLSQPSHKEGFLSYPNGEALCWEKPCGWGRRWWACIPHF